MFLGTTNLVKIDSAYRAIDQSLPEVLCKITALRKLQSIDSDLLALGKLPVDLHQSLRGVFLLPSLTSLTLDISEPERVSFVSLACHAESLMDLSLTCVVLPSWQVQDLLMPEDQEENDDKPRERSRLSRLNLYLDNRRGNYCRSHIDWFLGPRSPFEMSHIQTLHISYLEGNDEEAFNRLLRTIGCSLKHLEFYVLEDNVAACE
jgi:hypothetical protein